MERKPSVKGVGEPGDREGHARIDEEESETWAVATRAGGRKPSTEVDRPAPHWRGCATRRLLTLHRRAHVRRLFNRLDQWIVRRVWSFSCKRWRNTGWRKLPERKLYGERRLVNLLQLIPSMASYYRQKGYTR